MPMNLANFVYGGFIICLSRYIVVTDIRPLQDVAERHIGAERARVVGSFLYYVRNGGALYTALAGANQFLLGVDERFCAVTEGISQISHHVCQSLPEGTFEPDQHHQIVSTTLKPTRDYEHRRRHASRRHSKPKPTPGFEQLSLYEQIRFLAYKIIEPFMPNFDPFAGPRNAIVSITKIAISEIKKHCQQHIDQLRVVSDQLLCKIVLYLATIIWIRRHKPTNVGAFIQILLYSMLVYDDINIAGILGIYCDWPVLLFHILGGTIETATSCWVLLGLVMFSLAVWNRVNPLCAVSHNLFWTLIAYFARETSKHTVGLTGWWTGFPGLAAIAFGILIVFAYGYLQHVTAFTQIWKYSDGTSRKSITKWLPNFTLGYDYWKGYYSSESAIPGSAQISVNNKDCILAVRYNNSHIGYAFACQGHLLIQEHLFTKQDWCDGKSLQGFTVVMPDGNQQIQLTGYSSNHERERCFRAQLPQGLKSVKVENDLRATQATNVVVMTPSHWAFGACNVGHLPKTHKASTQEGVSGAPILNAATGRVIGIHLGTLGEKTQSNYWQTVPDEWTMFSPAERNSVNAVIPLSIGMLPDATVPASTSAMPAIDVPKEKVEAKKKYASRSDREHFALHHEDESEILNAIRSKRGKKNHVGPVFTETEYQQLLDWGISQSDMRKLVRAKIAFDDGAFTINPAYHPEFYGVKVPNKPVEEAEVSLPTNLARYVNQVCVIYSLEPAFPVEFDELPPDPGTEHEISNEAAISHTVMESIAAKRRATMQAVDPQKTVDLNAGAGSSTSSRGPGTSGESSTTSTQGTVPTPPSQTIEKVVASASVKSASGNQEGKRVKSNSSHRPRKVKSQTPTTSPTNT